MKLLKISKKKGASLLEIIISIAILAIISIPIGGILITSVKTSKSTEDKQIATLMGQQMLEEIRVTDFLGGTSEVQFTNGVKVEPMINHSTYELVGYNLLESSKTIDGYDFDIQIVQDSDVTFKENQVVNNCDATIFVKLNPSNSSHLIISNNKEFKNEGSNLYFDFEMNNNKLTIKNEIGSIEIINEKNSNIITFAKANTSQEEGSVRIYFIDGNFFNNLNISVDDATTKKTSLYLDKSIINEADNSSNTEDISVSTKNGVMTLYNNVNTVISDDKKMGNVYKTQVKVYKNSKLLFEGNGITNIVSN